MLAVGQWDDHPVYRLQHLEGSELDDRPREELEP